MKKIRNIPMFISSQFAIGIVDSSSTVIILFVFRVDAHDMQKKRFEFLSNDCLGPAILNAVSYTKCWTADQWQT